MARWWRISLTAALVAVLLVAGGAAWLPTPPVGAANCAVTSTADSGSGTFRAAINRTDNFAGQGCETISFQAGLGPIGLTTRVVIARDVTVEGGGQVLQHTGSFSSSGSVLLTSQGTIVLQNLTLRDGKSQGHWGAGLSMLGGNVTLENAQVLNNVVQAGGGGGIYASNGTLRLVNTLVQGNTADNTDYNDNYGGGGLFLADNYGSITASLEGNTRVLDNHAPLNRGGGIHTVDLSATNTTKLDLTDSTVGGNTAGIIGEGGGIFNDGTLRLTRSIVSGNTAAKNSGGIFNRSMATLLNSIVSGNVGGNPGGGFGGGLYNSATLTLTDSTVSGNSISGSGGGLANEGTATLIRSTVSGNSAGYGGGLHNGGPFSGGTLTLINSTVSGNNADYGGGLHNSSGTTTLRFATVVGNSVTYLGGGLNRNADTLSVLSSVVAGNRLAAGPASDCLGTITSQGRNLWGDQAACPNNVGVGDQNLAALNVPIGSVLNTALANNGGPTQTHALVAGSPAIDKGDNVTCASAPPGGPGGADQRGVARPQGAGCDVGAVEYVAPPAQVALTVQTVGSGSVARAPAGSGGGPFGYPPGTVVTLTPQPAANQTFAGWTVDGVPQGWPTPLTLTMNGPHTVVATFKPTLAFPDVGAGRADFAAIVALASRGTIKGYQDGRYGPDDKVRRDQMAALIARAMPAGPGTPPQTLTPPACLVAGSWDCEVWGNNFSDGAGVDPNLWRNAGTMQHYGVSIGYSGATCAAKRVPSPCFGPADNVTYAQTISFITRAMKAKGYWADQPAAPLPYQNVPTAHQLDVRTFHFYTSGLGGVPSAPTTAAGWEAGATRGWFARALWAALDSYWKVDRVP